jgi:hypothetical protein
MISCHSVWNEESTLPKWRSFGPRGSLRTTVSTSAPSPQPLFTIMTERERWIVYPLLFLALGAALRDKLVDRTTTKSIVCQELLIVDEDSTGPQSQRMLAKIGRAKSKSGGKSKASLLINGDL